MDRDEHKDRKYLPRGDWEYTKKEKIANWFYYYKWWLVGGAVGIVLLGSLLWTMLGIGVVKPDCCFALVTDAPVPEETVEALEKALATLCGDINGDGKVKVTVNAYVLRLEGTDVQNTTSDPLYDAADLVRLQADISSQSCQFFLMTDPNLVHERYQILTDDTGGLLREGEQTGMSLSLAWEDCPTLRGLEVDGGDALPKLYLGRRGYADTSKVKYYAEYEAFWALLTQNTGGQK